MGRVGAVFVEGDGHAIDNDFRAFPAAAGASAMFLADGWRLPAPLGACCVGWICPCNSGLRYDPILAKRAVRALLCGEVASALAGLTLSGFVLKSAVASSGNDHQRRPHENSEIGRKPPLLNVFDVFLHSVLIAVVRPAADLPRTSQAGTDS